MPETQPSPEHTEETPAERLASDIANPPDLVDPVGLNALNAAFARAQMRFPAIPKNRTATVRIKPEKGGGVYTYKYADLADILKTILPILGAEGLSLRQPLKRLGNQLHLFTELHHASGQFVTDDGIPIHNGISPQEFGSELSYMRRYGSCTMLGVAPDEDEDGKLADKAAKDQRDLAGAERRTAPATAAAKAETKAAKAETKAAAAGEATLTEAQSREWNKTRKESGWTVEEATKYVYDTFGVPLPKIPASRWEEAIAWARTKPDMTKPIPGVEPSLAEMAEDTTTATTIDHAQKESFLHLAKKHGKSSADIDGFLRSLGIDSMAAIRIADLGKALEWAAKTEGPVMSEEEKRAREGFGILEMNLTEQAAVIERWKSDWPAIAEAVSLEIDRRDAAVTD